MPKLFLKDWWQAVSRELPKKDRAKLKDQEVTLVFVTKKESQKLNHQYRKKNYPTDVLSFAGMHKGHLGDLAICPEVVKKQAKEHRLTYQQELGYMVLHGLLHLLGYDHEEDERRARQMMTLQDKIFDALVPIKRKGRAK